MMKHTRVRALLSAALAAVLLAAPMTACSNGDNPSETGTGQSTGSSAETEAVTAAPRHDYMEDNVSANVILDRADYTNLSLTVSNSLKIEADDVQAYVENIRYQRRSAVNGTTMVTDQPLSMGDDAYIYYKGLLNGVPFEGGSNWDDASPYTLGLGSGSFIPGFEEALVGIVPNTTSKETPAEITVTFPEGYNEELGGKEVIFRIVVEYAVQYTLPEYNREFVEKTLKYEPKLDFYASDAALLEEFEEYVYDYLVSQNLSSLTNAQSAALWEHLLDAAECTNLPADEVNYYFGVYESEAKYYYEYYAAYSGESFKKAYPDIGSFAVAYFGMPAGADWKAELTKRAEEMVCRDMITHAIAEAEGFETVTSEEYEAQVKYWMDYYSSYYGTVSRDDVIKNVGEAFLRESALADKTDLWLMDQVSFTYEDGTPVVSTADK